LPSNDAPAPVVERHVATERSAEDDGLIAVAALLGRHLEIGDRGEPRDLREAKLLAPDQDPEMARPEQGLELAFRHGWKLLPARYS